MLRPVRATPCFYCYYYYYYYSTTTITRPTTIGIAYMKLHDTATRAGSKETETCLKKGGDAVLKHRVATRPQLVANGPHLAAHCRHVTSQQFQRVPVNHNAQPL